MVHLARAVIALATLASGALAAPPVHRVRPDLHIDLGNGLYVYNWTGVSDNHVEFEPRSDGFSSRFAYKPTEPSYLSDFAVGVGWSKGTERSIKFSGNVESIDGLIDVSVYGWINNLSGWSVEYWVREYSSEPFPGDDPGQGVLLGTVESDGSVYDIWQWLHVALPDVDPSADPTRKQIYFVRRENRPEGGTVTMANHFQALRDLNVTIGELNDQVLVTEGWRATGSSDYTVSEV
ncbi:glycoside hydrolase family 11 protein [Poronia punctata]|nr:glycoside hydrolase family 11 protein [Poronia punctata]